MKNGVWETAFANGPDWDSAIFHIPYYAYRYSGDRRIVDLVWENMERTLRHFATLSENCLLRAGVGDWASCGATCDKQITDTAYYAIDAQMMAEMAAATGRDPAPFAALFARIRDDFRAAYVKNGELTAISLSCTGTVQVVVAQVQARLEADIAFTQREADFPQSVIDALRQ